VSRALARRRVLAGAGALVLATGVGACVDDGPAGDPDARLRALLERWFGPGELSFMAELGDDWAAALDDDAGTEAELAAVSPGPGEGDEAVIERWREQLDAAFGAGEVVVVRGFCLGRTEAQLCLAAASIPASSTAS